MNSAIILLIALIWLYLGYKIYGRWIEKRLRVNDKFKTPAYTNKDKTDFSPAKKTFLIGHHFASIAGAGPIIGPILAASYFGWLPGVVWILFGVVFIGAMHDYVSLMASVRNEGKGVAEITRKYLNRKAGWIFGLMIWVTLILIITVFSVSSAESIVAKPDLVIPLLTITLIAVILGYGVKKYNWNDKIASLIALFFIFLSVWIGYSYPLSFDVSANFARIVWISIIFVYAFLASVLPVEALLRPRDYLSALQMMLIMFVGIISLFILHPTIDAPTYMTSSFPLWPVLFITIACGAISGFHGLVASGTTSKQLEKESHGRSVGYGGMLLEGLLAIFVTLVVVAGVKWGASPGQFKAILDQGWIVLFSSGYGNIVGSAMPFLTIGIAGLLGAFMVNQFILTSVDTSTRLGRFLITETLIPKINNKIVATIITLVPAYLLAITNSYETLWRLFGTSNQMIASITLIGISSYFIMKKINVKFIVIPALLVLLTTLASTLYLTFNVNGYISTGNYSLGIISLLMFALGIYVAFIGLRKIIFRK